MNESNMAESEKRLLVAETNDICAKLKEIGPGNIHERKDEFLLLHEQLRVISQRIYLSHGL